MVKEFLREYLRGLATLPVAIQNGVERLVTHFDGQMCERENQLSANGFRRPLWEDGKWRDALLDRIHALCWTDRSGERVMRLLTSMFIEALEFESNAATILLTTVEEFAETWAQDNRDLFKAFARECLRASGWNAKEN